MLYYISLIYQYLTLFIKCCLNLYHKIKKIIHKSHYKEKINEENLNAYFWVDKRNKLSWMTQYFFIKSVACKTFPLRMAIGYIKSDSEYNLSETFAGVNASWISHIDYTYIRYKHINECDK